MIISRSKPGSSRITTVVQAFPDVQGNCVGCENCSGRCAELIDVLTVPDIVLSKKRESQ